MIDGLLPTGEPLCRGWITAHPLIRLPCTGFERRCAYGGIGQWSASALHPRTSHPASSRPIPYRPIPFLPHALGSHHKLKRPRGTALHATYMHPSSRTADGRMRVGRIAGCGEDDDKLGAVLASLPWCFYVVRDPSDSGVSPASSRYRCALCSSVQRVTLKSKIFTSFLSACYRCAFTSCSTHQTATFRPHPHDTYVQKSSKASYSQASCHHVFTSYHEQAGATAKATAPPKNGLRLVKLSLRMHLHLPLLGLHPSV
ncbi:hypothetical protein PMIN01_06073 [Paraphaeosphaeria minitans]|uniref:Uncharacterized protein n=1 Tax=Paraphaeosphaeria minitans TaxID=565426 RepID=A0A9P6GIS4_9PLEO|nr:hypothetical protein PMIN01_06073 [Paraphaeosphaeria minitans]